MRSYVLWICCFIASCSGGSQGISIDEALVYVKEKEGNLDLYQSDILGQWEKRLTDQPGKAWSPRWIAEAGQLVYYAKDTLGELSWLKRDLSSADIDTLPFTHLTQPQLSPQADMVYYIDGNHIKRVGIDGVHHEVLTEFEADDSCIELDRKGQQMAFISDRGGTDQLYLMDLTTKGIKRLSSGPMIAKYSSFSPDGKKIAVCLALPSDDPKWDIFIMDLSSRKIEQLTRTPYSEKEISWSLSGKKIAFHATTEADGYHIYTIDIADGKFTKITSGDHYHGQPTWVRIN